MYKGFWRLLVTEYGGSRKVGLICALTICVSLLEGINIGLLVPLLEKVGSPGKEGGHWITRVTASLFDNLGLPFEVNTILLVLAFLIIVISGLKYLRLVIVANTQERFVSWVKSRNMWNLLRADVSYFHQERLGVLTDSVTNQPHHAGTCLHSSTEIISNLGITAAYLVAAFLIAPLLTAVAFGMLLVILLAMQHYMSMAKVIGANMVTERNELQVAAMETLGGIYVVKSFMLERLRWGDFTRRATEMAEVFIRFALIRGQMTVLLEIAMFGMIGGMVFVGVSILNLDLAVVAALLFILYRLSPRMGGLNASRQQLIASLSAVQTVEATLHDAYTPKIVGGDKPFRTLQQGIELKGVGFSYSDDTEVLRDINFTIEKGKMTAISGTSGAGKTTLIDLILRFYDPAHGSIQVDGGDLRELDLEDWRRSIGVVGQDTYLFNDTVANNIGFGQPDLTMDDIMAAASQAYAHDFILQLPKGYETQIGDRGWNLSGGQRQRLALARAIMKNPEILILDEATSSLDSESEQFIQKYINDIRSTRTIVVVAHRMSTIQSADKIVVLEDGKIVEEGDWHSLLAGEGVFANYHRLQVLS